MIAMTLADVAAATGGQLHDATGSETVAGPVVIDSRTITPYALFVAMPGEHADGHDFARAAVAAGAGGVLAARPTGVPSVVVEPGDDSAAAVVAALGRLAHAALDAATSVRVTAATGSSGKTTTKDLLAQLLPAAGPTIASPGSYNNDLGVPLTVLSLDADTRQLVLEMGSRGIGDIARLCSIARPDTGIVLNVGLAHVGEFGSREHTARAKGELVEALPADGVAVLNADDALVAAMASRTDARVLTFGRHDAAAGADVQAERITLDEHGRPRFRLTTPAGSAEVALQLVGEHHVSNALAAAAGGIATGLDIRQLADGLRAARPLSRWRMEVHHRPDGVTVVNDAYNANPDSMAAALRALVSLGRGRRTWAILGEMLELGSESPAAHARIGALAVRLGVTRLVAVGSGAAGIHAGALAAGSRQEGSVVVPHVDDALDLLHRELHTGDVVLVKSSRDAGLRRLGEALVSTGSTAESTE